MRYPQAETGKSIPCVHVCVSADIASQAEVRTDVDEQSIQFASREKITGSGFYYKKPDANAGTRAIYDIKLLIQGSGGTSREVMLYDHTKAALADSAGLQKTIRAAASDMLDGRSLPMSPQTSSRQR